MSRIKAILLAMLAVCALSVAATSAASAHEFINKGSTASKLVGTAEATQTFTTAAGKVECTKLEVISGTAPAGTTASLLALIQYGGCRAFGLAAKVSVAFYLFDATGEVKVEEPIKITATACEVVVPIQTVKTVTYTNQTTKAITLTPAVTGITSEGKGGACEYAKESKGTYEGKSLVSLENGAEIEYK